MHRLTSQLLANYPYSKYATPQTIQRGRAYYKDGRVWSTDLVNDQEALCIVNGDTGEYTVEIEIDKKTGELNFECECYFAEEGNFCKHMVAAALEMSEYLRGEEDDEGEFEPPAPKIKEPTYDWKTKLMQSMALMPRQSTGGSHGKRYAIAIIIERDRYNFYNYGGHSPYSYSLEPFVIKESEWQPLQEVNGFDPERVNHLLENSKNWIKTEGQYYSSFNSKGCLNLTQEAISFVSLLYSVTRMYGGQTGSNLSNFLPMLAKFDIPVFLGKTNYPEKIERRLHIQPEPIQIQIDMQQDDKKLSLQAGFDNNGTFTHIQKKIEVMTQNPTWVFMDDTIAQIENSRALERRCPSKATLSNIKTSTPKRFRACICMTTTKKKYYAPHFNSAMAITTLRLPKMNPMPSPASPIHGNSSAFTASLSARNIFINCSPTPSIVSNAQARRIRMARSNFAPAPTPMIFSCTPSPRCSRQALKFTAKRISKRVASIATWHLCASAFHRALIGSTSKPSSSSATSGQLSRHPQGAQTQRKLHQTCRRLDWANSAGVARKIQTPVGIGGRNCRRVPRQ